MLSFEQMIQAVDSHTAGAPTRVVTGGLPQIPGATMVEKRDALKRDHDHIRRALVLEPRGHDAVIVAYLLPPTREDADLGVVFVNDAGYLGMCGHGSIGLATTAVAMGMVPAVEVLLCTPAVRNIIREGRAFEIPNVIETNRAMGMSSLDSSIAELFFNGMISREEAIAKAAYPDKLNKQPAA